MTKAIDDFHNYLVAELGYSILTAKNYTSDIRQFFGFMGNSADVYSVETWHIREYMTKLYEDGLTGNTRSRKLSSIKSFFRFMIEIDALDRNPAAKVKNPKREKKVPKIVQANSIIEAINVERGSPFITRRDAAIVSMLYATGIRSAELVEMTTRDMSIAGCTIRVNGKGKKERVLPIPDSIIGTLESYLTSRASLLRERGADCKYLWVSNRGAQLQVRTVQDIVRDRFEAVDVYDVSPHMLRASFATHLLENNADLKVIQELMGHEDISTTEQYLAVAQERIVDVYKNAHPLARGSDE